MRLPGKVADGTPVQRGKARARTCPLEAETAGKARALQCGMLDRTASARKGRVMRWMSGWMARWAGQGRAVSAAGVLSES